MRSNVTRRVAVLTSGGDAPGLNAVIRSVVKTAILRHGWEVLGVQDGFEGLIGDPRVRRLGLEDVSGLLPRGGSLLGCSNRGHLRAAAAGDTRDLSPVSRSASCAGSGASASPLCASPGRRPRRRASGRPPCEPRRPSAARRVRR